MLWRCTLYSALMSLALSTSPFPSVNEYVVPTTPSPPLICCVPIVPTTGFLAGGFFDDWADAFTFIPELRLMPTNSAPVNLSARRQAWPCEPDDANLLALLQCI